MSTVSLSNSEFRRKYEIPDSIDISSQEWQESLSTIDDFLDDRVQNFSEQADRYMHGAERLLEEQLSNSSLVRSLGQDVLDMDESEDHIPGNIRNHARDLLNIPVKTKFLTDAKFLFKEHVGSVLKETKSEIKYGTPLEKLGAALSVTGKTWEGISIFWHELVKKRPILKPLDALVVRPMAITAYSSILPALGVVKACEFVGRSISAVSKTGKWSSIKDVAVKMTKSTIKHFERVFGVSTQGALFGAIDQLGNLSNEQKGVLKSVAKSHEVLTSLDDISKNPEIIASVMAGAVLSAAINGEVNTNTLAKQCKSTVSDLVSGKYRDAKLVNLKDIAKDAAVSHLSESFGRVFGDRLPEDVKFKDVVHRISTSQDITEEVRHEMLKGVSKYAVGKVAELERDVLESRLGMKPKSKSVQAKNKAEQQESQDPPASENRWTFKYPKKAKSSTKDLAKQDSPNVPKKWADRQAIVQAAERSGRTTTV